MAHLHIQSRPDLAAYLARPVPRYTSYPTAPHFNEGVGPETYANWLARIDPAKTVSLYLHVPFCRELCWYCGCNMKLASRDAPLRAYTETLIAEIDILARHLPDRLTLSHLHWGGGTPTALSPEDLARVMGTVFHHFDVTPDAELAIESDPRTLTEEMIQWIGALGFTRASFGVQEFDPDVQRAINRIQPPEMVEAAVTSLREAGVGAINFDLIYGLPNQTVETLTRTIALSAAMAPDRLALFGYAHVPWMAKKQRLIPEEALPDAAERLAQANAAAAALVAAGYRAIGLDHFAKPDDPLSRAADTGTLRRNFQGYTTDQADTLLGVGATSIGRTEQGYVQNIAETGAWTRAVEAGALPVAKGRAFTGEDKVRAQVIEGLMCQGAADLSGHGWGAERQALDPLIADGLATLTGDRLVLTEAGRTLARVVASVFDEYLGAGAARHSRAV